MNSTTSHNDNKTNNAWGLDTNTLDDWLENDLKQSNLFQCRKPSTSSVKCSLSHIISQDDTTLQKEDNSIISIKEEEKKEKPVQIQQQQQQQQDNNNNKSLPAHLIPLIKVYSLLNIIRQNENLVKENKHNHINNKIMYTPPAPPSPIMSISSSNTTNTANNNNANTKKRRGNNRAPVDLVVKRQRNTDAARRSRLRKAVKMETLEKRVSVLKTDNERLRVKVAVLETEICHATEKDQRNRQRVLELEAQLANAHKQLVQEYKNGE